MFSFYLLLCATTQNVTYFFLLFKVSEHIERLVQLIQGDEPNQPLIEGEDITTLEVDESQIERPSYFAPVTGVGSALSNLSMQSQGGGAQKATVGDEDEDDKIEEI